MLALFEALVTSRLLVCIGCGSTQMTLAWFVHTPGYVMYTPIENLSYTCFTWASSELGSTIFHAFFSDFCVRPLQLVELLLQCLDLSKSQDFLILFRRHMSLFISYHFHVLIFCVCHQFFCIDGSTFFVFIFFQPDVGHKHFV